MSWALLGVWGDVGAAAGHREDQTFGAQDLHGPQYGVAADTVLLLELLDRGQGTAAPLALGDPGPEHVGELLVDVTVARDAKNEYPGCPTHVCVLWLGFPQWDGTWGIAEPQIQRLYLSDVSYGGRKHLFVAVVYPDDPRDMKEFLPHAKDLIATVQAPATSA